MSASTAWRSLQPLLRALQQQLARALERVVLSLRVALPVLGHQDPPQVRDARRTATPNMSKTSRSSQFAAGQTPVTDGTGSPSATRTFTRTRWRCRVEYRQ